MKVRQLFVLLVVIAAMLTGCSSVYQSRAAAGLPASELAILEYNGDPGGVTVTHIDGDRRGMGIFRRFELAPGNRSVAVIPTGALRYTPAKLNFIAKSGATYELKYQIILSNSGSRASRRGDEKWQTWIIDKSNGETVSTQEQ